MILVDSWIGKQRSTRVKATGTNTLRNTRGESPLRERLAILTATWADEPAAVRTVHFGGPVDGSVAERASCLLPTRSWKRLTTMTLMTLGRPLWRHPSHALIARGALGREDALLSLLVQLRKVLTRQHILGGGDPTVTATTDRAHNSI